VKSIRHPGYLRWIRTLPCSVCHTAREVEAAHTGPHGLSQKSSAIPLCARHHRTGYDSYHRLGPRKFAEVHELNIRAIVSHLSAKPMIRVESGTFVGRFGNQEYALGSTEAGVARAIRRMSELRREIQAKVA
jgi:hypothetical protein